MQKINPKATGFYRLIYDQGILDEIAKFPEFLDDLEIAALLDTLFYLEQYDKVLKVFKIIKSRSSRSWVVLETIFSKMEKLLKLLKFRKDSVEVVNQIFESFEKFLPEKFDFENNLGHKPLYALTCDLISSKCEGILESDREIDGQDSEINKDLLSLINMMGRNETIREFFDLLIENEDKIYDNFRSSDIFSTLLSNGLELLILVFTFYKVGDRKSGSRTPNPLVGTVGPSCRRLSAHKRVWGPRPRVLETDRRALQDIFYTFFDKKSKLPKLFRSPK